MPLSPATAHIALGANLGDRRSSIDRALALLDSPSGVSLLRASSIIETDAVILPGAPPQPPYLNAAAAVSTTLSARALLDHLLDIERRLGRDRAGAGRWAPRTIDLDLLLFDEAILDLPRLILPHPRLHERPFVLDPLAEIAADVVHPALGPSIAQLKAVARGDGRHAAHIRLRTEHAADAPAIHALHTAAFPTDLEARLVDALRESGDAATSLIVEQAGRIIGHILFSPVAVAGKRSDPPALGLAPIAVHADFRRRGVGARLIRAGIDTARALAVPLIVVLGEPAYYARFGFRPASALSLTSDYTAGDAFMALPLTPRASLPRGAVRYASAFAALA